MIFFLSKKHRDFYKSLKADVREYTDSIDLTPEQKRALDAKKIQRDWKRVGDEIRSAMHDVMHDVMHDK